jgi:PKD repeat protein
MAMRATLVALLALALAAPAQAAQPLLGDGAWSWFGDPRAVTHDGRTYVGWVDREGDVKVSSYDHATGERVTAVLQARLDQDDHANPSLHVRPDGRLVVFYSRHNGPAMHYRVSSQPEDVSAWEPPRTVPTNTPGIRGYTYPNPMRLADESATYLFWRGGNYNPTFSVQQDGETAWSAARNLIAVPGERPYAKYHSNGADTVHVAFTNAHPMEHGNVNLYYARVRGGTIERANGTAIGSLAAPIAPSAADLVYDGAEQAWVHDVAADSAGRPVIVLASFPSAGDHRYRYARWTGSAWQVHEMVAAGGSIRGDGGSPYYSGGLTLDHEDPSRVYLSRRVGPTWEVETWTTPDGGASWTSQAVTSGSAVKNVRPVSPRGMAPFGGDLGVVWMRGAYDSYVTYQTSIATTLGNSSSSPPVADIELSPRAGPAPLAVRFDGSASRDPDGGAIASAEWDFGDGTGATGLETTHSYSAGRWFPTLTVTDSSGAGDVLVEEVVVGQPTAPFAHTGAARPSGGGAVLHGAVDPENQATSWAIEYGPTREYGLVTPAQSLPAGDSLHQVSAAVGGLEPGRAYHYRVVATNDSGSTTGENRVFVAGAAPGSDAYRDAVLATPGLRSWWRLGEASGASAREEVSGAASGAYEGRYLLGHAGVLGPLGDPAAGFDGSSGGMAGPGATPATSATLEGWFRWRAGVGTLRDNTASGGWLLAFEQAGQLTYRLGGQGFQTGVPIGAVRDGEWHHLVAVKDGAAAALYVDGVAVHSSPTGAGSTPPVSPWHVMRNGTNAAFSEGEADEVAIYERALTAAEVRQHHDIARALAGTPVPDTGRGLAIEPPAASGPTELFPRRTRTGRVSASRGRLRAVGAAGARNALTAKRRGRRWIVSDGRAPLTAGRGCTQVSTRSVACRATGIRRVEILGGARADSLGIRGRIRAILIGGTGNDRLTASGGATARLSGGTGNDRLRADRGRDDFDGGSGRDLLLAGPGDRVSCGRGRDVLLGLRAGRGCERVRR